MQNNLSRGLRDLGLDSNETTELPFRGELDVKDRETVIHWSNATRISAIDKI